MAGFDGMDRIEQIINLKRDYEDSWRTGSFHFDGLVCGVDDFDICLYGLDSIVILLSCFFPLLGAEKHVVVASKWPVMINTWAGHD